MKIKHYITVATNSVTGEFAFCSTEDYQNIFTGVLSADEVENDREMMRFYKWREQFEEPGSGTFSCIIVASQLHQVAAFFTRERDDNTCPLVVWVDLESYVEGFCVGHQLPDLSIVNIASIGQNEPLVEAVHLAKLWNKVLQLPESYSELKREVQLDTIGFEIELRRGSSSANGLGPN